jgi:hypothetical protein
MVIPGLRHPLSSNEGWTYTAHTEQRGLSFFKCSFLKAVSAQRCVDFLAGIRAAAGEPGVTVGTGVLVIINLVEYLAALAHVSLLVQSVSDSPATLLFPYSLLVFPERRTNTHRRNKNWRSMGNGLLAASAFFHSQRLGPLVQ